MEAVGRKTGNSGSAPNFQRGARETGLILDTRAEAANSSNNELTLNFHFSASPTVTAGFIGFAFDIRK